MHFSVSHSAVCNTFPILPYFSVFQYPASLLFPAVLQHKPLKVPQLSPQVCGERGCILPLNHCLIAQCISFMDVNMYPIAYLYFPIFL